MIPDWMDLVVWGHEHESRIEAVESVGTFRVVQPGSSVATRLVEWESVAKKVTVLEIAGSEFRVRPVRLANFKGFKTGTVNLSASGPSSLATFRTRRQFNESSTSERSFSRAARTWLVLRGDSDRHPATTRGRIDDSCWRESSANKFEAVRGN